MGDTLLYGTFPFRKWSPFLIFFGQPVPAVKARKLGFALLIHAIERGVKLTFKSYERLFPNQDYLPESGLGEPSCFAFAGGQARKLDNSVFVKKSRSRKKFPAGVNCCCKSQKKGKKVASKRFRRKVKVLMHQESYEQLPFLSIELTSPWNLGGDGNSFYGFRIEYDRNEKVMRK